jgi:methyltransferase-like protein
MAGSNLKLILHETSEVFLKHLELKQIEKRDRAEVRKELNRVYTQLADGIRNKFMKEYKIRQLLDSLMQ